MDSWVHESVEDNEGSASGSTVQANGSCVVEDSRDKNDLNLKGGAEDSGHEDLKPEASPPLPIRKGLGLKKWRRFRRDVNRDVESSIDAGNMVAKESPRGGGSNPSKRGAYADRKQKSEGSVSSTNAVVRSFDGFNPLDDATLGLYPSFAAGTDSENSEDRSSKSSTAASAPRTKYEFPVVGGFRRDRSNASSLNGKNVTHPLQFGQHEKGRIETSKKARGERVKIEKENSHSSVESDSRSTTFPFAQGTYSVNNGVRSEGTNEYDGENGDEVQGSEKQVNDGHEGFEDLSPEDVAAGSSWTKKEETSKNRGSFRDNDPLAESLRAIQSAQEALQEELLKFKEIGNDDVPIYGPVSELCNEYIDVEQQHRDTRGAGSQSSSRVEIRNEDLIAELEDLFKQKVEAEVEYLLISRTAQSLSGAAVDTVLEQQKALTSLQTKVLDKLEDGEEIASVGEILKLQNGACKYGSCFVLQLVFLVVFLSVFIHQLSQDRVEVVPT